MPIAYDDHVSRLTLAQMDEAMRSFDCGDVGEEFELEEVRDWIDEPKTPRDVG